ncbi:MAG: hypothetical protein JWM10_2559 [Myxococcaceae bacterium]|nr:hypothetical protein [Myxococcaceae bacterium]
MRPPRYLGTFNGCAVFRIGSLAAGDRLGRRSGGEHFAPGLYLAAPGVVMPLPPSFADEARHLAATGQRFDDACSSPRLARSLRALHEGSHGGAARRRREST